jgi:hypothetical protein
MKSFSVEKMRKLIIPVFLIVIIVALALMFSLRRMVTLDAEHVQRKSLRRERSRILEEEQRTALDLARRIAKDAFMPPRMLYSGEEHVASVLVQEASYMKAAQLRVLIRELAENREIAGTDRALLVSIIVDAWLKENENRRTRSLWQVLEVIAEVLPELPPGYDILPVSTAMGRSLEWDLPLWVDFMEDNWSRWSGTSNAEVLRRDLLRTLNDPQLKVRIEKLPHADVGN